MYMQIDRKIDRQISGQMEKMMDRWTQHLIYGGIEDRQADKRTKIQTDNFQKRQKYRQNI
jgi:hypothetical protein